MSRFSQPVSDDDVDRYRDKISPRRRAVKPRRPAFDQGFTVVKVKGKDRHKETTVVSTAPKKLTKHLKRHLRKVWAHNKAEVMSQLAAMGQHHQEKQIPKLLGIPDPPTEGMKK